MFTFAFWKDTAERAIRAAATSFIAAVGGDAFLWNLGWKGLVGIPATAAILEIALSLSSVKIGQQGTASMTDTNQTT
jgi:hypothetical protein